MVGRFIVEEVDTGADIAACDETEGESIAAGRDAVGAGIIGAVQSAVLSAGDWVGAKRSVPLVTGVAVGVAGSGMEPAPVRVEDDGGVDGGTTACGGTLLGGQLRMSLRGIGADLLTVGYGREGKGNQRCSGEHR